MRITQNSMNRTQLMGLNDSLGRLQRTQEMLTSGKRLVRPSDSPVDTVSAMRLRDQQRSLSALGENIKDGLSRMQAADDALTRSQTMLTRIRTLAVAGANGVAGPQQRAAYASEIEQIRQGMVQLSNTQYAGQPVFGGTTANSNAFDPTSGKFLGNDDPVLRKVTEADGAAGDINIGVSGLAAFGDTTPAPPAVPPATPPPAPDPNTTILAKGNTATGEQSGLIDRVVLELSKAPLPAGYTGSAPEDYFDPAKLGAMLTELDSAQDKLSAASSTVGARVNRLTGLDDLNGRLDDGAKVALSKVEDVDFIKAAMDMSIQSNAYNAALQASAKIIQPSLMDFLR